MRKFFVSLLLVYLTTQTALHCQALENYFSDDEPKERGLLQTSLHDGEYIFLGGSSFDNHLFQPSIIKIDTQGNVIWSTTANDNTAYPELTGGVVKMILSDGFIYAIYYHPGEPRTTEIWKVNSSTGEIEWRQIFGSYSAPDHLIDYDNERILIAYKEYYSGSKYLVKFALLDKQNGNIINSFKVGDLEWDKQSYGIGVDSNKDIYYTKSDSIFKVSSINPSIVLWKKRHEGVNVREFHKIYIDEGNGIFLFGNRNTTFTKGKVVALNKVTGDLDWDFTVSANYDMAISDFKVTNGSIYATWKHTHVGGGVKDIWTTKINKSTGTEQWQSSYSFHGINSNPPTRNHEAAHDLEVDSNGDILLTGYYNASNYGPGTWGILKLNGNTGTAIYERSVPQDLPNYHEASVGLSIHLISGKIYFLGNIETRQLMLRPISMPALVELNSQTGDMSIIKYFTGEYRFPSKTVCIKEFQSKMLLLKQTGRYVTIGLYDDEINPIWETEIKKLYMLFGSNMIVTPDNRIVVTAYASQHGDVTPYYLQATDSLYTFVLNSAGQKIQENRFVEYGEIFQGRMSRTDVFASGNKIFVFFQNGENYYLRKIEGQSVSDPIDLGLSYNYSPKNLVFDESSNKIKLLGVKNGVGVRLVEVDKNSLNVATTAISIPFSRINHVLKVSGSDVIISGFSSVREPIARYNLTESKLVWLHTNLNQGEILQSFMSNEPLVLLSVGHKANDIFIRKTNIENGIAFWAQSYSGDVSLKEVSSSAVFNSVKNKIILVGYQQVISGTGNRSVFIDAMTIDGSVQHEIIAKQGVFAGDNEAFDVDYFSDGITLVGGNLNHATHGKAGFVYKLDIASAQQCNTYSSTSNVSICSGESYIFEGIPRTVAGYYSKNYFTKQGCDSLRILKLEVFQKITSSVEATICFGETYFFNDQPLTEPGEYEHMFRCDSVVRLSLSRTDIDNKVTQNDLELTANQAGAAYQWYKNTEPIVGATGQTFSLEESGTYMVRIELNGCIRNSETLEVVILSLEKQLTSLKIYPNPVSESLILHTDEIIPDIQLILYNQMGQIVYSDKIAIMKSYKIDMNMFPPGTYIICLKSGLNSYVKKILVK